MPDQPKTPEPELSLDEKLHRINIALHHLCDMAGETLVRVTYPGFWHSNAGWPARTQHLVRNNLMTKQLLKQDINRSPFDGEIVDPPEQDSPEESDGGPKIITPTVVNPRE